MLGEGGEEEEEERSKAVLSQNRTISMGPQTNVACYRAVVVLKLRDKFGGFPYPILISAHWSWHFSFLFFSLFSFSTCPRQEVPEHLDGKQGYFRDISEVRHILGVSVHR